MTRPILLIAPDIFWSSRLRTLLESRGYSTATARNEREVREAMRGEPLGAILDLSAPGALDMLSHLRKGVQAVPVLAFTGHTDTRNIERATALGVRVAIRGEMASRAAELVAETFGPPAL